MCGVRIFSCQARFALFCLVGLIIPACGGGGGGGSFPVQAVSPVLPVEGACIFTAQTLVTAAAGGSMSWPAIGDLAPGSITVPPGAVAQDVTVSVCISDAASNAPPNSTVYRFEPDGLQFTTPATLVMGYRDSWVTASGVDEATVEGLAGVAGSQVVEGTTFITRDPTTNQVTVQITHFSICWAIFGALVPRLFWQKAEIVDKNISEVVAGDPFWNAAGRKLLVIHGITSHPSNFTPRVDPMTGISNILACLEPWYGGSQNVAYYKYPSGKSIAQNARDLLILLSQKAQSGFRCDVLAHSMGGLVARYMIEELGGSQWILRLITLGTPHEGTPVTPVILECLSQLYLGGSGTTDGCVSILASIPGAADLNTGSAFLNDLNSPSNDNTLPYYTVVADSDSVVPVPYNPSESGSIVVMLTDTFTVSTSATCSGHKEIHEEAESRTGVLPYNQLSVCERVEYWLGFRSAPVITTVSPLLDGQQGAAYPSLQLLRFGGAPPFTWAFLSGTPPPGLTLSSSGVLSGTPTSTGNFNFAVEVTDAALQIGTKNFSMTIDPPGLFITTTSLPSGTVGSSYSATLTASGGVPGYTWAIIAGSLPPGLTLNTGTGAISGTPASANTFGFTAQVTDSALQTDSKALSITIAANAPSITTTSPLPNATQGQAYSQTLSATGGVTPYAWSLVGGALPSGLSLAANGLVSGTPTVSGGFSFTAEVRDNLNQTDTRIFLLTVLSSGPVTLTLEPTTGPSGGDAYVIVSEASTAHDSTTTIFVNTTAASEARAFLYFDLGQIPGTATIQTARLEFTAFSKGGTSTINVNAVVAGGSVFQEGTLTWNNQPGVAGTMLPGAPPASALGLNQITLSPSVVQSYIGPGLANWRGLRVTLNGTNVDLAFRPSEYSNATERPRLVVTYQP